MGAKAMTQQPANTPEAGTIQAELGRCLSRLVLLFPDPSFQPPEVVIDPGYRPLAETPLEPPWGVITLYSRDLVGSSEDVLTILLHKAIHAYHAFLWRSDCSCWSYHTRLFRRQAEQLGLRVGRHHPRYGWSQTSPTAELGRLFEDLAPALDLPRSSASPLSRRVWHCGQQRFPSRAELGTPCGNEGRRLGRSLQVHRRQGSAMVRLGGRWLRHLGFYPGQQLKVEGCAGRVTIEARPEVRS
jgi:hypothetical protein